MHLTDVDTWPTEKSVHVVRLANNKKINKDEDRTARIISNSDPRFARTRYSVLHDLFMNTKGSQVNSTT